MLSFVLRASSLVPAEREGEGPRTEHKWIRRYQIKIKKSSVTDAARCEPQAAYTKTLCAYIYIYIYIYICIYIYIYIDIYI